MKKRSYFGYTKKERERRNRRLLAEYAETGWECGDNANYVVYATIPARFIYNLKSQADIVSKPENRA